VPILVVSVRGAEREKVELLDAGADDHIVKPFGVDELLARIRAVFRRLLTAQARTAVLVAGNLEIDLKNRCVRRAGQSICLKYKEFEVLRYLMRHAGELIPHRGNRFDFLP
jgi:two-component system, OmpR family, KDP operon response regulator KdpE